MRICGIENEINRSDLEECIVVRKTSRDNG